MNIFTFWLVMMFLLFAFFGAIITFNANAIDVAPDIRLSEKWFVADDYDASVENSTLLLSTSLGNITGDIDYLLNNKSYNSNLFVMQLPEDCTKGKIAATGSMRPVIHGNHSIIKCPVHLEKDLQVGDMVSFNKDDTPTNILHRIIKIEEDADGWYCITKGDHCTESDGKVRFDEIDYVVVGIFY